MNNGVSFLQPVTEKWSFSWHRKAEVVFLNLAKTLLPIKTMIDSKKDNSQKRQINLSHVDYESSGSGISEFK